MTPVQIAFAVTTDGYKFEDVDFSDVGPEYKNIRLKSVPEERNLHHILVSKNSASTSRDDLRTIIEEASWEAQNFVYAFTYASDIKITSPECVGYYQKDRLIPYSQVFPVSGIGGCSLTATVGAGGKREKEIKKKMKEDFDLTTVKMYHDSVNIIEPIGRFISLYTILLHKFNDNQSKVDEALLLSDPTIAQYKSPIGKKKYETLFTRFRNELSHKRKGSDMLKTHEDIKRNIGRFEALAKSILIK